MTVKDKEQAEGQEALSTEIERLKAENASLLESLRAAADSLAMVEAACARALAGDKDRRSLVATLTLVIERSQEMRAALHDEERSAPPQEGKE